MTLYSQIQANIPLATPGAIQTHIDAIGSHFIAEMTALKLQRPTADPTVVVPVTPIGSNLSAVLTSLDALVASDFPDLTYNPWRENNFISSHVLSSFVYAYEQNLIALIAYYGASTGGTPPGYPTTPIPQPITIPDPAVPPLVKTTLQTFFEAEITAKIPDIDNMTSLTPEVGNFFAGWVDFMLTEVFV